MWAGAWGSAMCRALLAIELASGWLELEMLRTDPDEYPDRVLSLRHRGGPINPPLGAGSPGLSIL
jgi:hypothetical protein